MKKVLFFLSMAIWMLAIATSCNNDETVANQNQETVSNDETVATTNSTATVPVTTIGWGALTSNQRTEIMEIAKAHPFGGAVNLNPPMEEVVAVTKISDMPSPCSNQTLLEYKYSDGLQTGTNKILIQGHLDNIKSAGSIPDLLNNSSCCILYGGCIQDYECNEPLPGPKKCTPCGEKEKKQPSKECKPCKGESSFGSSARQGDGAAKQADSDGENKELPRVDFE